jgi:hypothetical protein
VPPWHQMWHVAVLATTLLAAAAAVIVWLAPLLLEPGSGIRGRARRPVGLLVAVAALLLAVEWLWVHGGSL